MHDVIVVRVTTDRQNNAILRAQIKKTQNQKSGETRNSKTQHKKENTKPTPKENT